MSDSPLLHVVDDDAQSLDLVCSMLRGLRLECKGFAAAEELLDAYDDRPGCILANDRLPGMGGLDLQTELQRREFVVPVILMTAKPETQLIVQAMRNGAVAVLDKPCAQDALWKAVETALAVDAERRYRRGRQASMQERLDSLTDQEREVMWQIVDGSPNKITARRLGVSVRTIENRRRSVFAKLGIRSVAELVATVMQTTTPESRSTMRGPLLPSAILRSESLVCSTS
jgi:FixJ family two-component response regulator